MTAEDRAADCFDLINEEPVDAMCRLYIKQALSAHAAEAVERERAVWWQAIEAQEEKLRYSQCLQVLQWIREEAAAIRARTPTQGDG